MAPYAGKRRNDHLTEWQQLPLQRAGFWRGLRPPSPRWVNEKDPGNSEAGVMGRACRVDGVWDLEKMGSFGAFHGHPPSRGHARDGFPPGVALTRVSRVRGSALTYWATREGLRPNPSLDLAVLI